MTKEQKVRIAAKMMEDALAYADDPDKGRAAGYTPRQIRVPGPAEIGRPRQARDGRSSYVAWLYGIAEKDLLPGTWRIDQGMGEGRISGKLVIF